MSNICNLKCRQCGIEFVTASASAKYCPDCRAKIRSEKAKEREAIKRSGTKKTLPYRPLTDISEYLFCKYHYLGESVKQIADDYCRNPKQVEEVIEKAKANGNYDRHIRKLKLMGGV